MAFVESVTSLWRRSDTSHSVAKQTPVGPALVENRLAPRPLDFCRTTGYHNTYSPARDADVLLPTHRLSQTPNDAEGCELPPAYTCTVAYEGRVGLKLEGTTPFDTIENGQWHDVYLALCGTMLSVHTCKAPNPFRLSLNLIQEKPADCCGELVRRYTMQHAEVGLASDQPKFEYVPKPLVQFFPTTSLDFLRYTEPQLFDTQRQYVIRIRVEGQQLLFRVTEADQREAWINALCMAVDLAAPLDERTEPRYQTLPRRRRGNRPRTDAQTSVEEQEEICRRQFPHLLNEGGDQADVDTTDGALVPSRHLTSREDDDDIRAAGDDLQGLDPEPQDLARESQELDTSFTLMDLEQAFERRLNYINNLFHNVNRFFYESSTDTLEGSTATLQSSVDNSGKWDSNLSVDPAREARYRRRCMPALYSNSRYASTFVMRDGMRLEIDWEGRSLRLANPEPPRYSLIPIGEILEVAEPTLFAQRPVAPAKEYGEVFMSSNADLPIYLRSSTLPVPVNLQEPIANPTDYQLGSSSAPLLSAWQELKGWTQNVRAMAVRDSVPPTILGKQASGSTPRDQKRRTLSEHALRRLGV